MKIIRCGDRFGNELYTLLAVNPSLFWGIVIEKAV